MKTPSIVRLSLVALAATAAGCGSQEIPTIEPGAPPPPSATRPQLAQQFQSISPKDPVPPPIEPLPLPARRVAVLVRESARAGESAEDPGSEAVLADALITARGPDPSPAATPGAPVLPRFEVVNRQVLEQALGRDLKALATRKRDLDAEVLRNIASTGAELLALCEVERSGTNPAAIGREVRDLTQSIEAALSLVRTDDGVVVATGTGSSRAAALVEAKREAVRQAGFEAYRKLVERRDGPATSVTITIEGLRTEDDAAKVKKALDGTRGVAWTKPPSVQLGPDGAAAGVARIEAGVLGDPEAVKQVLRDLRPGFRLAGKTFEGNRWSFRIEDAPVAEKAAEKGGAP